MKTIEEAASECYQNSGGDINHEYFKDIFKSGVEFAQRWIPVEEELPEKGDEVLTKTSDEWYRLITFGSVGYKGFPSQVTHWRPIEHKL